MKRSSALFFRNAKRPFEAIRISDKLLSSCACAEPGPSAEIQAFVHLGRHRPSGAMELLWSIGSGNAHWFLASRFPKKCIDLSVGRCESDFRLTASQLFDKSTRR